MRHLKTGRKLSRRKEHRTAMLANLAVSVIKHGRVHTTDAKAKEVKPFLERLITFARRGDLHSRRIVLSRLKGNKEAVRKLFDEIGPRFVSRPGGYTRILKLGFRAGDNSPMSLIELVEEKVEKKTTKKKKARPKKTKAAAPGKAESPPAAEKTETEAPAEIPADEMSGKVEAEAEKKTDETPGETEEVSADEKLQSSGTGGTEVKEDAGEEKAPVQETREEKRSGGEGSGDDNGEGEEKEPADGEASKEEQ